MNLDAILNDEAEALATAEASMKARLEEIRRVQKNATSSAWQESLSLVAPTPEEKLFWATTIEKDALAQKSIKVTKPSQIYLTGIPERHASQILLSKLLVNGALKAGVKIPKPVLLDLAKSGLPDKYAQLVESESDK